MVYEAAKRQGYFCFSHDALRFSLDRFSTHKTVKGRANLDALPIRQTVNGSGAICGVFLFVLMQKYATNGRSLYYCTTAIADSSVSNTHKCWLKTTWHSEALTFPLSMICVVAITLFIRFSCFTLPPCDKHDSVYFRYSTEVTSLFITCIVSKRG